MTEQYGADWLTSGGIDDQWVTLRNVKFACDIEADDPTKPFLVMDLVPDDTDMSPLEAKRFGIGANWAEAEDGSEVTRTDGRRPQFHKSSKAGRLLDTFLANGGTAHAQAKAKAGDKSTPFQAAWWEGLHVHIKENDASFENRETGEKVEWTYFSVEDTDGWADSSGKAKATKKAAAKKPAKKAASKKAAAKPDPEPEVEPEPETDETTSSDSGDSGGSELEAQVREHCANTDLDSHDEWMMAVYADIPDVGDDEAVAALVDDAGAIWADTWE